MTPNIPAHKVTELGFWATGVRTFCKDGETILSKMNFGYALLHEVEQIVV